MYEDPENARWVGFNNGIYRDEQGRTRSAILLLTSQDGLAWEEPFPDPIIRPGQGWKRALVYQLCVVPRPGGEVRLYYNARFAEALEAFTSIKEADPAAAKYAQACGPLISQPPKMWDGRMTLEAK